MKKYTSGSFTATKYAIYKEDTDTITSFPASIIANGGNITPWFVYGNTVEGASVGEKTKNVFDKSNDVVGYYLTSVTGTWTQTESTSRSILIECEPNTTYTIFVPTNRTLRAAYFYNFPSAGDRGYGYTENITTDYENKTLTITTSSAAQYLAFFCYNSTQEATQYTESEYFSQIMINTGSTALPYEPYGYKIPVVIGSNTTNIYMADVLRKSTGADPVYDIMSSIGVITRNVDTDGTPLLTPTTESFTAPTLATVAGSQSVSFDTTIKPSKAELTYTGWHTHSDKKRSGGAWT